jgi:hypothetical protein
MGWNVLPANTTGLINKAVGTKAMRDNTIGSNNVAVGAAALLKNTSYHNIGDQGARTVGINGALMIIGFSNTSDIRL